MIFHITSLPHTQTTKDYVWCAYTAKVVRFCNMMTSLGHEVYLYGGTENEAKVTEFITVVTDDDRKKWFGDTDWNYTVFDRWDPNSECWDSMNSRAATEIAARKKPGDILGIISGLCQEKISKRLPDMRCVEWGVGYEGILKDWFHVFESYAWMHFVYGRTHINDGRFFDTVIPNSYEEGDFYFQDEKQNYLLFLGRPTARKGLEVISELAKRGHEIIMAGQGNLEIPGVKHVGLVRGKEKADLIANAKALLAPTFYIEPFGGVVAEAMLSGTPVITTDFGAFTETVRDGIDGFRCHTIGEFDSATEAVKNLDKSAICKYSQKFLTSNVRYQYETYFKRLQLLDGQGWYS